MNPRMHISKKDEIDGINNSQPGCQINAQVSENSENLKISTMLQLD